MRPSGNLLCVVAAWTVLGVLASVWPALLYAFWGFLAVAGAVAVLQFVALRRIEPPAVERRMLRSLSLASWGDVALRIESRCGRRLRLDVYDHHPVEMQVDGQPWTLELGPEAALELTYRVRATKRGERRFAGTQIRMTWTGCLWTRSVMDGAATVVRVYPNFKAVARHALLAVDDQVRQLGVRRRRQRGTGLDFHQLREYREGDVLRQIDWKATSRQHKLISREYQEERDQRIVFLLDCGRRMHARDGELSHFDHALNAILLLSYVAIRQGDSVGVLTFSGQDRWLPPVKGAGGVTTVLNHVYDLDTTLQPSDFLEAAQRVMRYMPKRSLVVLVTNLREEDSEELQPALHMLRRRHLVLLASLRETIVEERLATAVTRLQDALRTAMAARYVEERRVVHEAVGGFGVHVLDVSPANLPPALVDRYLDIKSSGAL